MKKAIEVMQEVEKQEGREVAGPVVYETMAVDSGHCQGDVCIVRRAALPGGAELDPNHAAQIVDGFTLGSRHIIKGMDGVKIYRVPGSADVWIESPRTWTLTHPEHGWVTCPAGIYESIGQVVEDVDHMPRRVLD